MPDEAQGTEMPQLLSVAGYLHTDSAERILYNETIVSAVINAIGDTEGEPLGLRAATVIAAIEKAAGGKLLEPTSDAGDGGVDGDAGLAFGACHGSAPQRDR